METRAFLQVKLRALSARVGRLTHVSHASVGIRPQDMPYAPTPAHFEAANRRLGSIYEHARRRFERLRQTWSSAPAQRVLVDMALVEREIDRARRAFGMFFEVFSQRGSEFAPSLAAHDVVATDCYAAVRESSPQIFRGPLLKPLCYMEHGFSPATFRRGVLLSRLLGETNPFPLIRIPWDRDNPWQTVFMHEVGHNLQADLGIWQENRQAVVRRLLQGTRDPLITRTYGNWHKELFADLIAVLLGGAAAAWGMAIFLAHPAARTMTFRPGGAHPTAYLRIHVLVEMLRRMGLDREAARFARVWEGLHRPQQSHRMPVRLLSSARTVIPQVVDEIAFQTRRNLAQRALADVVRFTPTDEEAILAGGRALAQGRIPEDLPPRHLMSAAAYAMASGKIMPRRLTRLVVERLNAMRAGPATITEAARAA